MLLRFTQTDGLPLWVDPFVVTVVRQVRRRMNQGEVVVTVLHTTDDDGEGFQVVEDDAAELINAARLEMLAEVETEKR